MPLTDRELQTVPGNPYIIYPRETAPVAQWIEHWSPKPGA